MKVFLRYEDNSNEELHKTLKITLPKSWKNGPSSRLLTQFVESYNSNETLGTKNPLDEKDLHLELRQEPNQPISSLASDAIVIDAIPDRSDLYVVHGPSRSLQEIESEEQEQRLKEQEMRKNTVACTHFGCKNRFPPGGPYPECCYHKAPPVFHETAKFWSCCPNKKAYDWDDFQNIPGCQTGACTDKKEEQKQFLGGTDLRAQAGETSQLKSIDDFNKSQAAGGSDAAPVLDRLKNVLIELGVEAELYNQVVNGMKRDLGGDNESAIDNDNPVLLENVVSELGKKLKAALKAIAVDQLRIK